MPAEAMTSETVIELKGVSRRMGGVEILRDVSWKVRLGEHWVILGPNGSGKTTLARIASLRLHPTSGSVRVLGTELGRADIRPLLPRVGYAAASLADQLRPELSAHDVVMTAKNGALEPWWHEYDDRDRSQALKSLERVGIAGLADHTFGTCSSGEKQRVLIARALMTEPSLLILDEPTAALDLAGREAFVATLDRLAAQDGAAPMVLITHHVDEIPTSFTHAMLMANGSTTHVGAIENVLTSDNLSSAFDMRLTIERRNERWTAWANR